MLSGNPKKMHGYPKMIDGMAGKRAKNVDLSNWHSMCKAGCPKK